MHKLPDGVRIPSVEALKDAIDDGNIGFAILLNGGVFSRKTVTLKGDKFIVENHIDGSVQTLTKEQLFDSPYCNIGEAMKKGSFVVLEY